MCIRDRFISVSHVDNQTGEKVEMKPDEAFNIPPEAGQLSIFVKTNTNYSVLVPVSYTHLDVLLTEKTGDWLPLPVVSAVVHSAV